MRGKVVIIGVVVGILLFSAAVVLAGGLEPPSGPSDAASQMVTLEQIYDRLDTGAASAKMTTFTEPATGPGTGTMHTLDDIMDLAPEVDDANGATATDVVSGTTFWGLRSDGWGLITGILPSSGVVTITLIPKTGQTTPIYTNDDGHLQKGAAWPVPRFITGTTGVVTDTLTGLIWLENAHCAQNSSTWLDVMQYDIPDLNSYGTMNGKPCGDTSNGGVHQTDWRLPNVRELQSLLHYGVYNPALPNTAGTGQVAQEDPFIGVQPYNYWTSTTRAEKNDEAWNVDLTDGASSAALKTETFNI